jgi:hypothetical protein
LRQYLGGVPIQSKPCGMGFDGELADGLFGEVKAAAATGRKTRTVGLDGEIHGVHGRTINDVVVAQHSDRVENIENFRILENRQRGTWKVTAVPSRAPPDQEQDAQSRLAICQQFGLKRVRPSFLDNLRIAADDDILHRSIINQKVVTLVKLMRRHSYSLGRISSSRISNLRSTLHIIAGGSISMPFKNVMTAIKEKGGA